MSIASLEREITWQLRAKLNEPTLRVKDIQEWSTTPIEAKSGEEIVSVELAFVALRIDRPSRKKK